MLLMLHNLPLRMRYPELKALIQSKCGSMQVILDNLVQNKKYKSVTVGLADDDDAAIFVRKINGLFIDDCQLYVEDSRQKKGIEQPYRPIHFGGGALEVPAMLTSNVQNTGIPQTMMPMDTSIGGAQYGMYNMNMQNAAMDYNQQFMPVLSTGQFSMGAQSSFVDNASHSENREQSNARDSHESRRRQDLDWEVEASRKRSRQDTYSANRDESRSRSPNRHNRGQQYDHIKPSDKNVQNPLENISYPLHLYARRDFSSSSKSNTFPDIVNSNTYDNAHGSPYYSQNLQTESSMNQMNENSSNIRRETARGRPGFDQDPPLGFNLEPKRGSHFEEEHTSKRSRYDQNPYRRPGFDRESPQRGSGSVREHSRERSRSHQEPPRHRPRVRSKKKKTYDLRPRSDQEPKNDKDPSNIRSGGNARSGFDRDSYYSGNRGHRPEPSKDRYFDQSASSSVRPRDKPWSSLQGSEAKGNTVYWNQTSVPLSKPDSNESGRFNVLSQRNENTIRPILKKSRPNFGEDFIPIGGGPSKYPPPTVIAPRPPGPRGANPAEVLQDQPYYKTISEPHSNLEEKNNSQPNDNSADISPSLKQAIHVHNNTIFQTAAAIARGIMRNLQLERKETHAMLKPLKKAIKARFDLLLGDTMCNSPQKVEEMYRNKYPVSQDHKFFDEVLQNIEKGRHNKASEDVGNPGLKAAVSANAPSTSAAPPKNQIPPELHAQRLQIIANLAKVTAMKDGNVPKYPNADKKNMKQQKQLGKEEYLNEDFYELPELTKNALDQELDELCNIFNDACKNVDNQMEKTVIERVITTSLPEFRRSIKLSATKRILNVNANLCVRIFFYGKQPTTTVLNEFLMDYGVVSCRKSVKAPNFLASVDSYDNYDRLLALGNAKLGDTTIAIKPLQITGYKARPNAKKVKKSQQDQAKPEIYINKQNNVKKSENSNNQIIVKQESSIKQVNVKKESSDNQIRVKQETSNDVNKETDFTDFTDVDIDTFAEEDLEDY